jgi:peptide/nickel transport system substrate-binding protein
MLVMLRKICNSWVLLALAIALSSILLSGVNSARAAQTPESPKKILRITSAFDFKSATEGKTLVFETLVKSDMNGNFFGWLADSYDVSPDGMTYTFHLKKGVKFHNGEPFDARSAKLSIEYICNTTTLGKFVSSVNVLDDFTVEMKLSEYYALVFYALSSYEAPMICAEDLTPKGDPNGKLTGFIGTGAFRFVDDTYQRSVKAELARFDDYWDSPSALDGIEFLNISDPNAMVVALESDEADVIGITEHHSSIPYVQIPALRAKGYKVAADNMGRFQVIEYNCKEAPFDNADVRMAFNLAVDRELMAETLFHGLTTAANVITAPWFVDGPDTVNEDYYKYDPKQAVKLLEKAGWNDTDGDGVREKDGKKLEVTLVVPNGEANADAVAVYLQSELLKIGAKVNVLTLESSAASALNKDGKFNMYVHHSGNLPSFPGGIAIGGKYHSTNSGWKFSFHSKELDSMIDKAFTNPDIKTRNSQIDAIWEYLHAQAPCMPLYNVLKLCVFNPRVSGYHTGSNMFDMSMVKDLDMDMEK